MDGRGVLRGRGRRLVVWSLPLALACATPPVDTGTVSPFHDGTPTITELTWTCDVDEAQWTFKVRTSGWTGGGKLWMARDANTWEQHTIHSTAAASDGSWDQLELDLAVAADWRDATSSSTRWRCDDQDALSYQISVTTPDGSQYADCRRWGADGSVWEAIDSVPDCETPLLDSGEADTGA